MTRIRLEDALPPGSWLGAEKAQGSRGPSPVAGDDRLCAPLDKFGLEVYI
jgi:hypothetical protein